MKALVEIWHDGNDEDRYWQRAIEIPFAPAKGMEMVFCPCCSGERVSSVEWRVHDDSFRVIIKTGDMLRTAEEHDERYKHWGFVEDEELRGCSMGRAGEKED